MKVHFSDEQFSFQYLRILGTCAVGGADIGECLMTAARIRESDFESWHAEWRRTAELVEGYAREAGAGRVSAGEAYMRAFSYYRASEFFLHGDPADPRIVETWGKSRTCFRQALALLDVEHEVVAIPYEGTTLPGYFFPAGGEGRPTVVLTTGFDGTAEELYLDYGVSALKRGYNVLAFEGPGQGAVIREQGLAFRPDWETVMTPAVDWLLARPEVDQGRVALIGASMGGYLAPRAAACDHRIAALVANGGVFDADYTKLTVMAKDVIEILHTDPDAFDAAVREVMKTDPAIRWAFQHGMYVYGAASPHEWLLMSQAYTLEGMAGEIACPTLVIEAGNERSFPGRARLLYNALACEKEWMPFPAAEGIEEHCGIGGTMRRNQLIFDWLDRVLGAGKREDENSATRR
ncbi:alpha/beta hydrolase family protein [Methanofollis sp. UBA420]|jgi:alpha-beta hydrolase superfamily lysophospholipase|uniref:alpha/beta hydrolase family protein n=1 Tax=Methanofollis sp. UBA420 TaxID=1915514 RepID=UPI00316AC8C9